MGDQQKKMSFENAQLALKSMYIKFAINLSKLLKKLHQKLERNRLFENKEISKLLTKFEI